MPRLSYSFPHQLGRKEAGRRIRAAIENEKVIKANIISAHTEKWDGENHLDFTIDIFNYSVGGTLDILDDSVDVAVDVPLIATMMKGMIEDQLRQEVTRLLK